MISIGMELSCDVCIVVQIYEDVERGDDVTLELQGKGLDELVLDVVLRGTTGEYAEKYEASETIWISVEVAERMRAVIDRFLS